MVVVILVVFVDNLLFWIFLLVDVLKEVESVFWIVVGERLLVFFVVLFCGVSVVKVDVIILLFFVDSCKIKK